MFNFFFLNDTTYILMGLFLSSFYIRHFLFFRHIRPSQNTPITYIYLAGNFDSPSSPAPAVSSSSKLSHGFGYTLLQSSLSMCMQAPLLATHTKNLAACVGVKIIRTVLNSASKSSPHCVSRP
mmetsp:Transcript_15459/g.28069  ORF Transcript_15459/g.28069 Transcript_15459/m.28069 type:complete len:123 (+) Transcript_15459:22-390(+)